MATKRDLTIEQCLRRIVHEAAAAKDEYITIKKARSRAEAVLGLGEGFFKNDGHWKQKSSEIIRAAFEEDSQESAPSSPKPPRKPTTNGEVSQPHKRRDDRPKTQQSSEKTAPTTAITPTPASKANGDSQKKSQVSINGDANSSSSSESSSEEDENDGKGETEAPKLSIPKKPDIQPRQVNGVKRKASEQSAVTGASRSDEDSSLESETELEEPRTKKTKADPAASPEHSSAGSSRESSKDESSRDAGAKASSQCQSDAATQNAVPTIPPGTFTPPQGFTPLNAALLTGNTPFPMSTLDGKQIWHLTAPSGVSLSSITDIALDAIQSQQPVLTDDGIEYVLNEDIDKSDNNATIMIPSEDGYRRVEQQVQRSLQLQQKINLPNLTVRQANQATGSRAAANVSEAAISTVKPQPKGLRMRFKPPGFGSGKPGKIGSGSESTDEDETPPSKAAFQFPKTLGAYGTSTQQREQSTRDQTQAEATPKTPKKKRKERKVVESIEPVVNGVMKPSGEPAAVSVKAAEQTSATQGSMVNGTAAESMSKEERRRLKRERKEAKRKLKVAAS